MKLIFSQMAFFLAEQSNRRNMRFMLRFIAFAFSLVLLYTFIFHRIMLFEGRDFSPLTGLYWTLSVMSTLGLGDIAFHSDIGRMFSVLVLLSGIVLFMLLLPFTFIRFVYAPWLEAQSNAMTPRELPKNISNHVIIVGVGHTALSIVERCRQYDIPYVLLLDDAAQAISLFERGYHVVLRDLDATASYEAARADKAALVLALHDDLKNTNIAATVREFSTDVPLAAGAYKQESEEILRLAGCNHVFRFSDRLGEALARRVFSSGLESNIIGRFEGFCIAESAAHNTPLVGKRLSDTNLRNLFSLNVTGIWQGNQYMPARPDTVIDDGAVLLLAGTADKLEQYDRAMAPLHGDPATPVIVLGGGSVGRAAARRLEMRGISCRIVEQKPQLAPAGDSRYVLGNAADINILREAGIEETSAVIVTTHNDDLNIYLTIYCRKLRPDIQIISRSNQDRNVGSLYSAGANLVMSQAGMTANTIINLLHPGRVFMLTEGLNIFRLAAPPSLVGKTLSESGIRKECDCNVIATLRNGSTHVPPDPNQPLQAGDELIIIGTSKAEETFMNRYYGV